MGNVRELENFIERMVILTEGDELTRLDLPSQFLVQTQPRKWSSGNVQDQYSPDNGLKDSLRRVEKEIIISTLAQTDGNRTRAPASLRFRIEVYYTK